MTKVDTIGANTPSRAPAHWVRLRIPDRFKLRPSGIAQQCGWVIRKTEEHELYEVTLRENYERRSPGSLRVRKVLDAAQAGEASRYEAFQWVGQEQFLAEPDRQRAMGEAERLMAQQDRVQMWAAFSLLNMVVPDAALPDHLRSFYPMLAAQLPKSSLWAIEVDPAVHARRTIVRGLLAAEEAPELLARNESEFQGFDAGKGLATAEGFGLGALIQTALVAEAPGVLGMNTARLPGMITLLLI